LVDLKVLFKKDINKKALENSRALRIPNNKFIKKYLIAGFDLVAVEC
jgi:hypothetical protein